MNDFVPLDYSADEQQLRLKYHGEQYHASV
jgi:hypothetical protein